MPATAVNGDQPGSRRIFRPIVLGIIVMVFAGTSCAGAPTSTGGEPAARTIGQIQFSGNSRLSSGRLSQVIGIRVGDVSSSATIDGAMRHIVAAYRDIGRDLALTVDVTATNSAHTRVHFVIDEDGSGGIKGATLRSGARMGGVPPPPPPASRQ